MFQKGISLPFFIPTFNKLQIFFLTIPPRIAIFVES